MDGVLGLGAASGLTAAAGGEVGSVCFGCLDAPPCRARRSEVRGRGGLWVLGSLQGNARWDDGVGDWECRPDGQVKKWKCKLKSDRGQGRARGRGRDLNCWAPRTGPGARKTGGCGFNVPGQRSRCGEGGASGCPGPAKAGVDTPQSMPPPLAPFASGFWSVWCGVVWTGRDSSSEPSGFKTTGGGRMATVGALLARRLNQKVSPPRPNRRLVPLFLLDPTKCPMPD